MASLADIFRQKYGSMVWDTPQGASHVPGYGFADQQQTPAPQPNFIPAGGIPDGYAMMFQGPIGQQPRAGNPGLLDMLMNGSDIPNGIPAQQPQGLLSMIGSRPDVVGSNGPDRFAGEAPIPMQRPVKPDTYTVRKGDTLTSIAKRYGTTVKALLAKNPQIKNANKIVAGKTKIKI